MIVMQEAIQKTLSNSVASKTSLHKMPYSLESNELCLCMLILFRNTYMRSICTDTINVVHTKLINLNVKSKTLYSVICVFVVLLYYKRCRAVVSELMCMRLAHSRSCFCYSVSDYNHNFAPHSSRPPLLYQSHHTSHWCCQCLANVALPFRMCLVVGYSTYTRTRKFSKIDVSLHAVILL